MLQDEYQATLDLVRQECKAQVEAAGLPPALQDSLESRAILFFGEHPLALVTLPLVMFRALGGTKPKDVAPAGAAIEFLLAAADLLDDVQDRSVPHSADQHELLHSHYVNEIELVTALLLLGEQAMISLINGNLDARRVTSAISVFNTFKLRSFSGQYADVHSKAGPDSSIGTSFRITHGKSGSLGRCAAEVGAALVTDDLAMIELAGDFGEHLAIARQFHDDVANLWPTTGKLEDLEQLKATLPVTFAVQSSTSRVNGNGSNGNGSTLKTLVKLGEVVESRGHFTDSALSRAREEVFRSGGIHFAMLHALIHLVRARTIGRQLEKLPPGESVLERMASLHREPVPVS